MNIFDINQYIAPPVTIYPPIIHPAFTCTYHVPVSLTFSCSRPESGIFSIEELHPLPAQPIHEEENILHMSLIISTESSCASTPPGDTLPTDAPASHSPFYHSCSPSPATTNEIIR
ncbi:uncharacterized protein ARMOST_16733 [Armillaria ostoyae]|uniref:Uncharacterized protein n=1 Tax=Armillaria ostoyae TaxID=47428 RepID=A0A284RX10_ARMOS|nr:uncharacterized protein ARMOST_16733 [Armillaria ostoyae]